MKLSVELDEAEILAEISSRAKRMINKEAKANDDFIRKTIREEIKKRVQAAVAEAFNESEFEREAKQAILDFKSEEKQLTQNALEKVSLRMAQIKSELESYSPGATIDRRVDIRIGWALDKLRAQNEGSS